MHFTKIKTLLLASSMVLAAGSMSGCTAIALADAAASTAIGVTKVAVKGTTAIVGAAIPDGDKKEDKEEK